MDSSNIYGWKSPPDYNGLTHNLSKELTWNLNPSDAEPEFVLPCEHRRSRSEAVWSGYTLCVFEATHASSNLRSWQSLADVSNWFIPQEKGSRKKYQDISREINDSCFLYNVNLPIFIWCNISWIWKWHLENDNWWYFPYFCCKNRLLCSLESPQWGGSIEYHNSCFETK